MAATPPARRAIVRVRQASLGSVPPQFQPAVDGAVLKRLADLAALRTRSPSRQPVVQPGGPVPQTVPSTKGPSGRTPPARTIRPLSDAVQNLSDSFVVEIPPNVDARSFAEAIGSWEGVESVYVAPDPVPPPMAGGGAGDPAWFDSVGVPKRRRRRFGKGVTFVDLEWGCSRHEALPPVQTVVGENRTYFWHGNAVLGVIAGQGHSARGVAPRATAKFASPWTEDGRYDVVGAILAAGAALGPGDVLLVELQARCGDQVGLPVEVDPLVQDALALLRHAEIIVVEAAGNGGHPLDTLCVIGRGPGTIGDSGALLVGATKSDGNTRLSASNFGSRVALWAWGEGVSTAWSNPIGTARAAYLEGFDGTSAAAAIVAGVVIAIQSRAKRGRRWCFPVSRPPLTPELMEQRLFGHGRPVEGGFVPNLEASLQDLW